MEYAILAFVDTAVVTWAIRTAPTCTCGKTDCGGGCLRK